MATEEEGGSFFSYLFFLKPKISQNLKLSIVEQAKKNFLASLPKKFPLSSQKYEVAMRDPEENYPGSRCQMPVCNARYSLQNVR